jgi:uncharacterized membrane protein
MRFLVILLFANLALGAIISGKVYDWETLDPVPGTLIQLYVNATVVSQAVSDNQGRYSLSVGLGSYELISSHTGGNVSYLYAENVTLVMENTTFDIVLFPFDTTIPEITIPKLNDTDLDIINGSEFPEVDITESKPDTSIILLISAVIAVAALIMWLSIKKEQTEPEEIEEELKESAGSLPHDLYKLAKAIKAEGGRAEQRKLQKELGVSAAKMSLMITDLESRGIVKRIKRGRGNVITLTNK